MLVEIIYFYTNDSMNIYRVGVYDIEEMRSKQIMFCNDDLNTLCIQPLVENTLAIISSVLICLPLG